MAESETTRILLTVGRNVRAERVRRDLTQEALANKAGIAVAQLARIERGESDSGLTKYVRLARAIGVSPIALLAGVD